MLFDFVVSVVYVALLSLLLPLIHLAFHILNIFYTKLKYTALNQHHITSCQLQLLLIKGGSSNLFRIILPPNFFSLIFSILRHIHPRRKLAKMYHPGRKLPKKYWIWWTIDLWSCLKDILSVMISLDIKVVIFSMHRLVVVKQSCFVITLFLHCIVIKKCMFAILEIWKRP